MQRTIDTKKVLVAMSGGNDSSMAAIFLKEQGFEVVGLTMVMFGDYQGQPPAFAVDAADWANRLGIKHHVVDVRGDFNDIVRRYFVDEYAKGRTPDPCVRCNEQLKWAVLVQQADALGCGFVATGHYAQVVQSNGLYYVSKGVDAAKDQSCFLYRLPQSVLKRTIFPLGAITKKEMVSLATQKGFEAISQKSESMGVCFMNGLPLDDFLAMHLPDDIKTQGAVVDRCGIPLGKHKGAGFYTMGQKKGLQLTIQSDWCVVGIDPVRNRLVAGPSWVLQKQVLKAVDLQFVNPSEIDPHRIYQVKVRFINQVSYHEGYVLVDGDVMTVRFVQTVWGITAGQSVVVYDDQRVLGGGIVE
jgi:tRNA-uridine 2-sulfurtransferase